MSDQSECPSECIHFLQFPPKQRIEEMSALWYAVAIYMIGIAIVLYVRPKAMFRENGMWKEFGLATDADQTIFPFWMFAIIWAILSYALATLALLFFASVTMNSSDASVSNTPNMHPNASFMQPISTHPNVPQMSQAMPQMSQAMPHMSSRTPGYYILDPYANPAQPRYIYYGMDPPGFSQVTQVAN
jgi:hypothetical protein